MLVDAYEQLTFVPVATEEDIARLAQVADEIWHEYWPPIIGMAQTDYMVEQFQSVEAITRDITQHAYCYWMLHAPDGHVVGFTGGAVEQQAEGEDQPWIHHSPAVDARWPRRLFISKIYLYAEERGKHYASRVIEWYEQIASTQNCPVLYLTVNRENELGVRAYKGRGFYALEEVDNPIGQGFIMTDYIMVKEV